MKLSRNGFYSVFRVLLFLFPGIITGGCDLFNTSLVDHFLDNSADVQVTGFTVKNQHAMGGGTIYILPGDTTIMLTLTNPRNFNVRQELLGAPPAGATTITARQSSPTEIEVNIGGAKEGDDYALTLALQSPDGLRDFAPYSLRIQCVSRMFLAITAFNFTGLTGATSEIDQTAKTITVSVPHGTVLTNMTATVSHTGEKISPNPATPQNYTNPVTYTVKAADGSTATYTVTVKFHEITITGITVKGLSALMFGGLPASPVAAKTSITITIDGGVEVNDWYINVNKGPVSTTYNSTGSFTAPADPGFYNVNVIATVEGVDYSGSFGMTVK